MYIIAGLGNPGLKYRHTRHNAGFDCLDVLASEHNIKIKKRGRESIYGEGSIEGEKVVLIKPQTFMNESGRSLVQWLRFYQEEPSKLIVISDDIALDPGRIRIRRKGSAGGHNGLKSIISSVGSDGFVRVRVGVGNVSEDASQIRHVLSKPSRKDQPLVAAAYENAASAIRLIVAGKIDEAMNLYNRKSGD